MSRPGILLLFPLHTPVCYSINLSLTASKEDDRNVTTMVTQAVTESLTATTTEEQDNGNGMWIYSHHINKINYNSF